MKTWQLVAIAAGLVLVMRRSVFAAKPGATLSTKLEIEYARRIVARIWQTRGYTLTVTSGYDGTHRAQSRHYIGLAEDYRTRDVRAADLQSMVADVRATLGSDYDVVLEADHLHVEYDPK